MATLTVRDGHYILRWMENGQRRSQSLGKVGVLPKRDAQTILKAKELELTTGAKLLGQHSAVIRFGLYAQEYLRWRAMRYPDSQERIEQIVEQHLKVFEFEPLDMLQPTKVEQWMQSRALAGAKAETIAKELRTLKAIIHHAMDRDVILRDPLRIVSAPPNLVSKGHRFYEASELDLLYATAFDKGAVWKLMANTGMRRAEAMALPWTCVGSDAIAVESTEDERTKSGKWRSIPISKGAREALETLRAADESRTMVLPQIEPESLSRAFVKDAKRAGIGGHLHLLRATFISHLVRSGVPIRTVQIYAGHASVTTTEAYSYLSPGFTVDQVSELSL